MDFDTQGLEAYETNADLESKVGVWLVLSREPKRRIRVLREGGSNHKFDRVLQELSKPYRFEIQQRTMSPEKQRELMIEAYARAIVVDWEGFTAEGQAVACTPTTVKALFAGHPNIFDRVQSFAQEMSTFAQTLVDDAVEALGNSSNGSANTTRSQAS